MDIVSYAMGDGAGYKRGYADGQEGHSPVQRDIYDIDNYPIYHVGDAYLLERDERFYIRPNDVFTTSISDPRYWHGSSLVRYGNYVVAYDVITNVYEDNGKIRLTRDEYDNITIDNDFIAIIYNDTVNYYQLNAYKTLSGYTERSAITFEDYNDVIELVYIAGAPFILVDVDASIIEDDSNYFDLDTGVFVKGSTIGSGTSCKIFKPLLVDSHENLYFDESGDPLIADSITNIYGDTIDKNEKLYDVKLIQPSYNQRYLWFNTINTV